MKYRVIGTVLLLAVLAILYLATTESGSAVPPSTAVEQPAIQPLNIN